MYLLGSGRVGGPIIPWKSNRIFRRGMTGEWFATAPVQGVPNGACSLSLSLQKTRIKVQNMAKKVKTIPFFQEKKIKKTVNPYSTYSLSKIILLYLPNPIISLSFSCCFPHNPSNYSTNVFLFKIVHYFV